MSGYSIRITAFLPCGKGRADHLAAFDKIEAIETAMIEAGFRGLKVVDEFKPNRKNSTSAPLEASDGAGAVNAPASQAAPASETRDPGTALSRPQAEPALGNNPAAAVAADPLDIPENLRRIPR